MHEEADVVGGDGGVEDGGYRASSGVETKSLLFNSGISNSYVRCGGGEHSLARPQQCSLDVIHGRDGSGVT